MACSLYEVGVRHPVRGMLNRQWNESEIIRGVSWLKYQNAQGCDIYVRPARAAPSRLVLIDDLNSGTLAQLQASQYAAAVTVQTSEDNYQAWVKLDADLPANVRREIARHLARVYGGDPNSADAVHYGRLAGFTNRKPEHINAAGRSPFVLLDSYNGRPASNAAELVQRAQQVIEREQAQARSMAAHVQQAAQDMPDASNGTTAAPVAAQELHAWYRGLWQSLTEHFGDGFDPSRADWMAAVAMYRKGHSFQVVADTIAQSSAGIDTRKGATVADYISRTAGKAEIWYELQLKGQRYPDVANELLLLAQERQTRRQPDRWKERTVHDEQ